MTIILLSLHCFSFCLTFAYLVDDVFVKEVPTLVKYHFQPFVSN